MEEDDLAPWQVRTANSSDVDALLALAELTGGGFTNLPPERDALAARIRWSEQSLAARRDAPGDDMIMLVLENQLTGVIAGTAAMFTVIGQQNPFYSYKIATLSTHSRELDRTVRTEVLHLVNDYDGFAEVGGLFLHPDWRAGGLGRLLARSRYLFMAGHRARFARRVLAELRGVITPDGHSAFWDGLAGRFFGMDFIEADQFNAIHGNQFIADLMPKYPVYVALLSAEARAVIAQPHPAGMGARKLLESEGFAYHSYIDIFDGGPTMDCRVEDLRAVREASLLPVAGMAKGGAMALIATGELAAFRCVAARATEREGGLWVASDCGIPIGEEVLHVPW